MYGMPHSIQSQHRLLEVSQVKRQERKLKRRDFLKTAAAAATGGLILSGCAEKVDPYALKKPGITGKQAWAKGEEKWIASTCGQCPAGCGIRVRVVEGRAVKIEGNQAHPVNQGGIGPKGQSGLQMLYNPDRLHGPMRREGERGSGRWKSIPWDEAIQEISKTLRDLRAQGDPRGLVVVDGEPRGAMPELWGRFLEAYGSPNHVDHWAATDGGKVLAMSYMHGVPELPAYDWKSTRYVLSFGARLFESWCQTIHFTRVSSYLRRGMPGHRVKIVHVAPHNSVTAAKADEWVPIEPATYGALALGLAHILIDEDLYDKAFVRDHTFGFENWTDEEGRTHRGYRDLVMKDYTPEKVEKITGIPVKTIERIAHEMAENHPAIALADGNAAAATNGLGTAMSIHALNALMGNLERPGGLLVQRPIPLSPWPAVVGDETARKGHAALRVDGAGGPYHPLTRGMIQNLPEAILSEKPYPVKALFLYRSNPVFSKPEGRRWIEALRKVPLVVSFSPLPDESTLWADLVLPDHTYLERWDLVEPMPSAGTPVLSMRQPAVAPRFDTMATGDAVIRLAQSLGSPVSEAFPWKDYREALTERLTGILDVPGGSITASDPKELIKEMQKNGGWWASGYPFEQWETAFRTPSGKFEFHSQAIANRLSAMFRDPRELQNYLNSAGVTTRIDDLCLPHWEPSRFAGGAEEYPFVLVAYRGMNYAEGGVRHIPWLRELPLSGRNAWSERCEMHPEDAEHLKLHDGDKVWIESPAGRRRMAIQLLPGVRPGTVGVPLGHGAWPPKPNDAELAGGASLLVNQCDPLAGILALQGTRVRIRKDAI